MFDTTKKHVVVAMDHGRAMGVAPGIEDPGAVLDLVASAGADAVMTSYGIIKHFRRRMEGRIPYLMRLDGGPSLVKENWLENEEWTLLHDLDDAVAYGASGVCLMYFMGAGCELRTLEIVASICSEARDRNLPVMVEALPCRHPNIPDTNDAQMMANACRIAFEHGADILKTYYPGTPQGFATVTAGSPVPVLIAGGPKLDSDQAVLQMVKDTMDGGGKGVVFGRNIWQHRNPAGMVKALRAIIHDSARAGDAEQLLDR